MKRIAPCATVIKDVARKPIKKVRLGRERENVLPTIRVSRPPPQSWSAKHGYVGFVVSFKHRWIIEHYIIGETLFITSSTQPPNPHLRCFLQQWQKYFVYWSWSGYFSKMSKLNHLLMQKNTLCWRTHQKLGCIEGLSECAVVSVWIMIELNGSLVRTRKLVLHYHR